jgi:hypothetical protein
MNYEKLYYHFIEKYKSQIIDESVYTERHHIIPRHAGGGDSQENLITLTYKQHRFIHKLRYKAFKLIGDFISYRLMYGIPPHKKQFLCSEAGKIGGKKNRESGHMSSVGKVFGPIHGRKNVENGNLDKIRHLANNNVQRAKVKQLGLYNVKSGQLAKIAKLGWVAKWSQKAKSKKSIESKEKYADPANKQQLFKMSHLSAKKKIAEAEERSKVIIDKAERNSGFLEKKSTRSFYLFISPEGLVFESPIFAAKYYGNVSCKVVEGWCKRFKYGWKVIPKTTQI